MNTRRAFFAAAIAPALAFALPAAAADFPEGSPKFETTYSKALAKAKESGKPVIVVFSAAWCGPCQQMKKKVYPSAEVKPLHDKFVWAYLDYDEEENAKVAKEFGVNGIPHIQFLDKEGKAVGKQVGSMPTDGFVKKLEEILKKAGKPAAAATKAGS